MKKVVYTAVFGARDSYPAVSFVDGWDYVCFTSEDLPANDNWRTIKIDPLYFDPRDARRVKILSTAFLSGYDVSVWIDANIVLRPGWDAVCLAAIKDHPIAFLKHWELVEGPYAEIRRCYTMKKDAPERLRAAEKFLRSKNVPVNTAVSATGVIVRKYGGYDLTSFENLWFLVVDRFTYRDQVSLPYARFQTKVPYTEMEYCKSPDWWFGIAPHRRRKGAT